MPALGPDFDLAQRLANLERQVAALNANPLGTSFSQQQSDGSIGFELSQDPTSGGTAMGFRHGPNSAFTDTVNGVAQHPRFLYMGQLDPAKLPVGAVVDSDAGFALLRDTGIPMIVVTNTGGVQVFDKVGNLVLATDEVSGGIGTAVVYPTPQTNSPGVMPQTANTSYVSIAISNFVNYSTQIHWDGNAVLNGGGAGGSCYLSLTNATTGANIQGQLWTNTGSFVLIGETVRLDSTWVGASVNAAIWAASPTAGTPFYVSVFDLFGIGETESVISITSN